MSQRRSWLNRLASVQTPMLALAMRYGLAILTVLAAFGLRAVLNAWVGAELPAFILFYPAVMAVALLAGLGPGLLATVSAGLVAWYWILPPVGKFAIDSPVDRLTLAIFAGMGAFMSVVADLYRRRRSKAAVYDREVALREIQQEKEFLANLLEHASQPFAVGYPDGRLGRLNHAYEQLTGYSAEELRTLDWSSILTPPEWREVEKQKLDELNRSGRPVRYQKEYVRKDGSRVPVELLVHLAKDAEGKPLYYYSFLTDITERKRAEDAVRESEERLRFALETSHTGAWDLDLQNHTAFRSLEHDRVFGYAEVLPQWTYEMFLDHVLPEDRAAVDAKFQHSMTTGNDWDFETRIRRADGEIRWIWGAGRFRADETRRLRRMAGIVQDITERKLAEENLRESEQRRAADEAMKVERQRFNTLLDMMPAYVILLSPDYRVPFANHFFEERFGKSEGRRCYEYLFNRSEPCENCETFKVLTSGEPHQWEWTGPDGRDYEIHDFPFSDVDGSRLIMEVGLDVTEMKKSQATVQVERQRLFEVLETLPAMVCLLTPDYHVAFANRGFREKFGESNGRHCYEYCFGRAAPCDFCESYKALETGKPHHWEVNAPDGSVIEAHDFPFVDVDGSRLILEMDIDVTEQRRAEQELNQYRHRLEELVEERTAQLATATAEAQQLAAEAIQSAQTIRRLSLFPEQNPNPVLRIARDGAILYANPVSGPLLAHWGLTVRQSLPEDWARQLVAIADAGKPMEQEVECAGKVFDCLVTPIAGEEYVNIYGRDITDRKRREEQLAKLTRLYLVLSQVNEAIVRADDVPTLYADVCRIVAEKGEFPLVWVGEVRGEEIVPVATAGPAVDYLKEIKVAVEGPLSRGPSGTCLRENRAVINRDFTTSSATAPWRESALRHGLGASVAFPLRRQGKAIGALTLYSHEPAAFDEEQLGMFEALSADLSFALDAIDLEQSRQQAEAALQTSLQRFYSTLSSMYGSILLVSSEGKVEFANQSFCDLFDFKTSPRDLIGLTSDEVLELIRHRYERPDEAIRRIREVVVRGEPVRGEEVAMLNGHHCLRDFIPINLDGKFYGRLWHHIDITERTRAEERTRLLSEITARLLATDKPQWIAETLCRKVMEHLGCHAFFNYLFDEKVGRLHLNACAGIPEETAREIEWLDFGTAVCGCVARDGCRIVAEDVQNTPDPRTDLVRSFGIQAYACHPLMDQEKVIGTLSFGSRAKPTFAEDELGLMKAVADHVAIAMQRVRLLESLDRHARAAQAANAAKSQFLANMSHELRTPMNAILGMIDVALPKTVDPMVRDCLQTAKGSADLLLTLLNDLLDSARIEAGKLELESAPFSLRRMLEQITRVLSLQASKKGLTLNCRVPELIPDAVIGDRIRLQQVLLNLAGNAIKFTQQGEVEISLHVMEGFDEDKPATGADSPSQISNRKSPVFNLQSLIRDSVALEFAVRDTGIGIPLSAQERLFQPFAQADASMARRFGGSGLGLSICKSLVEMMGGRIWVESEPGEGSVFHFTVRLPLAKELPPDLEFPVIASKPTRKLRILLAEDNPANQKLAAHILLDRGHAVEFAADGHEAISLAAGNRYDVILMDVSMPGMDGLEATAAIRKREGEEGPGIGDRGLEEDKHRPSGSPARLIPNLQSLIPSHRVQMIAVVESWACGAGVSPAQAAGTAAPQDADVIRGRQPVSPAAAAVFDFAVALERCLNNRNLLGQVIDFFFKDADTLLPRIHAALQAGNLAEVGRLGHRLKGTLLHLGAEPAREAARRVEQLMLHAGKPADAAEAVNALDRQCELLKQALAPHRPPPATAK
jgi:PAS domain S-box-containing protein